MKQYTIFDYVKRYGEKSFVAKPFSEVDAACLCVLSYLNFNDLVSSLESNGKDVTLEHLNDNELIDYLLEGTVTGNKDRQFFFLCAKSKRFGNIRLNYVQNKFDKELAIQFFAITFILDNGLICVCYRGTDSSLVGWKEDLMMSINDYLPSYLEADCYLKEIGQLFPSSPLMVIGHSKGGALAVHSACYAPYDIQKRIVNIYDLDGPGFREALDKVPSYQAISAKIKKIMPIDSMIGILLESKVKAKIVKARSFSIFQHSPYNWYLNGSEFIEVKNLSSSSVFLSYNMHDFLKALSTEEKKEFIDIIFSVIDDSKIVTVHDMLKNIDRRLFLAVKSLSMILKNKEKREMFSKIIATYVKIYLKNISHYRIRRKIDMSKVDQENKIAAIIEEKKSIPDR